MGICGSSMTAEEKVAMANSKKLGTQNPVYLRLH
jgi:hypothetical protein